MGCSVGWPSAFIGLSIISMILSYNYYSPHLAFPPEYHDSAVHCFGNITHVREVDNEEHGIIGGTLSIKEKGSPSKEVG